MSKAMKTYTFYTGIQDEGMVKDGPHPQPADQYSLLLQGYAKSISSESESSEQSGQSYSYRVIQKNGQRNMLLLEERTEIEDGRERHYFYDYNLNFQRTDIYFALYELTEGSKNVDTLFYDRFEIAYLSSSADPDIAKKAANYAPGLVEYESKVIQNGKTSNTEYVYSKKYEYNMQTDQMGNPRFFYTGTKKEGTPTTASWIQDEVVWYKKNGDGRPLYTGKSIDPEFEGNGKITAYQYVKGTLLPTAVFNGMIPTIGQKPTCRYLHFENYLDEPIPVTVSAEGKLTSFYFTMDNVSLIDTGFLANRCLRTKTETALMVTNQFGILPNKKYAFSCWVREPGSTWKYIHTICENLESQKIVFTFQPNQDICHIILREISCDVRINVYDPETTALMASFDGNGTPKRIVRDRLIRELYTYQQEMRKDNQKLAPTEKVAIPPINIVGNSRFGGYNLEKQSTENTRLFNSVFKLEFPQCGKLLPSSGGVYGNLKTTTIFASGAWLTSNQVIVVKKGDDTFKIQLSQTNARLYINDLIVAASDPYISDQSAWVMFMIGSFTGLMVNGKLIISHINTQEVKINELRTGEGLAGYGSAATDILVCDCVLADVSYFDYAGNMIQSQRLREGRALLSQNFYDRRGNLVLETAPAFYPLDTKKLKTEDKPFAYRKAFASMDFSKVGEGGMTGEITDFFNSKEGSAYCELDQDSKWPFTYWSYEYADTNRLVKTRSIGAFGSFLTQKEEFSSSQSNVFEDYTCQYPAQSANSFTQYQKDAVNRSVSANSMFYTEGHPIASRKVSKGGPQNQDTRTLTYNYDVKNHTFYKNTYLNDELDIATVMEQNSYFNRFCTVHTEDAGSYLIFYDVNGNERLSRNVNDTPFKYACYDQHNRLVECGLFTPETMEANYVYVVKVNRPAFPNGERGTIKPRYRFTYDATNDGELYQNSGRLLMIECLDERAKIINTYDYLGNVTHVKYQISNGALSSQPITFDTDYVYHCNGKIKSMSNDEVEVLYAYNEFGEAAFLSIRDKHTNQSSIALSDANYDVFGNLCSYHQLYDFEVVRKWTMYNHLIYSGPSDQRGALQKRYLGHWNPDSLISLEYFDPTSQTVSQTFEYTTTGELASSSYQKGSEKKSLSMNYDKRGNLKEFNLYDKRLSFEYGSNSDQVNVIRDKITAATVASFQYGAYGCMTDYMMQNSFTCTPDQYYNTKMKEIKSTNLVVSMGYDCHGNLLIESKNNKDGRTFGYNPDGRLDYHFTANVGNTYFLYCGDLLVGQYSYHDNRLTGLVYDDQGTLLVEKGETVHFCNPLNMVFGDPTPFKGRNIAFIYKGLYYLESLDAYEDDGGLYFYQYGITSAPDNGEDVAFYTPYRRFGNCPL